MGASFAVIKYKFRLHKSHTVSQGKPKTMLKYTSILSQAGYDKTIFEGMSCSNSATIPQERPMCSTRSPYGEQANPHFNISQLHCNAVIFREFGNIGPKTGCHFSDNVHLQQHLCKNIKCRIFK